MRVFCGWKPIALAARSTLIDVVYPPRCAGCGRRGVWLCPLCDRELVRFVPPLCDRCGVPYALNACRCATQPPSLRAVRSAGPFAGWLRTAIIAFKYRDEWARGPHFGDALLEPLRSLPAIDGLVPVPLHPTRQRHRGYNQAAILARRAGAALSIPIREELIRVRLTDRQVGLDAAARRANVAGAFEAAAGADLSGQRLVLIDDVVTTGATLGACAEALLAAGAAEVSAVTLAREM
jgi:ComF family protein